MSDSSQNNQRTPTNQKPQVPRQPEVNPPERIPPSLRDELTDMHTIAMNPRVLVCEMKLAKALIERMRLSMMQYMTNIIQRDLNDRPPKMMYQ